MIKKIPFDASPIVKRTQESIVYAPNSTRSINTGRDVILEAQRRSRPSYSAAVVHPWQLKAATGGVTVRSANVFDGVYSYVPTIGGDPLTDDPPPILTITNGSVYARLEIVPVADSPTSPNPYKIASGYLSAAPTIVTTATGAQSAQINTTTGAVIRNAIIYLNIGTVSDGSPVFQYMRYSIMIGLCESGRVNVQAFG